MDTMHLRPDIQGYSESNRNAAFVNYQFRDLDIIARLIDRSRLPFVCFKPISDSHRILAIHERFPGAMFIWLYRRYEDVANSQMRKFAHSNRAIKLVCQGLPGGGWFDEGVSKLTRSKLRELPLDEFSEFDYECLTWWARNRIFEENNLSSFENVLLLRYEDFVSDPEAALGEISGSIGLPAYPPSFRFIHKKSIGRNPVPSMHHEVKDLCETLLQQLDDHSSAPVKVPRKAAS